MAVCGLNVCETMDLDQGGLDESKEGSSSLLLLLRGFCNVVGDLSVQICEDIGLEVIHSCLAVLCDIL